ncbi:MAG: hypothetical protein HC835_00075 [Oscillatoriales cyanobacterium RM2_1_1]|nr:hypothetical protein [Oscillatoriales cyanobacterium RM2_1_1]
MTTYTDVDTRTSYRRAIGVFNTRHEVESALYKLRDDRFNLDQITVIAPDSDPATRDAELEVQGETHGNKADEGAATGAATGGALGTIAGLLVGLGTLAIPGIGPILLAGAGATTLATTLAGTAIGAATGGIVGGLVGLGIPEERAKVYNERLTQGHYLVVVTGSPEIIDQAERILKHQGVQEWEVYAADNVEVSAVDDPQRVSTQDSRQFEQAEVVKQGTADTDPKVVIVDHRDDSYRS